MLYLNGNEIMQAISTDEVMEAVADAYSFLTKAPVTFQTGRSLLTAAIK
jgi:hypothetical protein